jgi:hypothetical protein
MSDDDDQLRDEPTLGPEDGAPAPETAQSALVEAAEELGAEPDPDYDPLPINYAADRSPARVTSTLKKPSGLNGFRMFSKQFRLDHADQCKTSVSAASKVR